LRLGILRYLQLQPQEVRPFFWALLYVLSLFMAYYLLRPIRDEWGVAAGVRNLPWLFTATLLAMLALAPLFAQAVRRLARRHFIALSYRFFALQLLGFAAGFAMLGALDNSFWNIWHIWLGRAFFVWLSVFNLFAVSLFWSLMVDVFTGETGRRLFGPLAAGATAGGMLGAGVTALLAQHMSGVWLMLLAALLLEVAVRAAARLDGMKAHVPLAQQDAPVIGGSLWAGLTHTARRPYLAGIALFILLYSTTSTLLYFQQADIVQAHFADRAARVAFFARMDLLVNTCTLVLQVFAASRLMGLRPNTAASMSGVALTLCLLPLVSMAAFGALALWPTLAALVAAQALRRIANFAFAKPARELLFTRAAREDRYKAKNFMDTVVYRSGDQVGSWAWAGMTALGLALAHVAWVALLLSAAWLALALWLGRMWQCAACAPDPPE